jgi:hypothetical protein
MIHPGGVTVTDWSPDRHELRNVRHLFRLETMIRFDMVSVGPVAFLICSGPDRTDDGVEPDEQRRPRSVGTTHGPGNIVALCMELMHLSRAISGIISRSYR